MNEKTWPTVAGAALVTVAVLLVGGAVVYLGASGLSGGPDDDRHLVLFFVLPLIAAAAAIGGAVALLSRARPRRWGRFVGLGFAIAAGLILFYLFVLPELVFPNA